MNSLKISFLDSYRKTNLIRDVFYLFLFKYRFAKNCTTYPKAIFIHRFLLNKRETQVLANKFFGVKLSAETDYKFYIMLFQTTKIQFSQSNSQQIVAWVLYVVMLDHCVSRGCNITLVPKIALD